MRVGMYGGKFLPFHMGHAFMIVKASTMVDELYVVLSHSEKRDRLLCGDTFKYPSKEIRLQWLSQFTKDMENVKVIEVEDDAIDDKTYNWKDGAFKIKNKIGEKIDIVFSSEEHYTPIFNELYPGTKHKIIDAKRGKFQISATEIRKSGAYHYWDFLPDVVKPFFVKKVMIIGTESCGKSTLTRNLAKIYQTNYVAEYGREICEVELGGCEGLLTPEVFNIIAYQQKINEYHALKKANKLLFVDTEAIITQYYSNLYLHHQNIIVESIIKEQQYDLWLFLEPDVKWVDDGTRSFGEDKVRLNNNVYLKKLLSKYGINYYSIYGNYNERLELSMKFIDSLIKEA